MKKNVFSLFAIVTCLAIVLPACTTAQPPANSGRVERVSRDR